MKNMPGLLLLLTVLYSCNGTADKEPKPTATGATNITPKKRAVLNHIAVYVKDLQVSTDFYHNIIGLDTIPEPFHDGRHTWFSIGAQGHLHVISGAQVQLPREKNAHLCFSVPSVDTFITTLTTNNIPYENWAGEKNAVTNRVDGVKQIYFQDPDCYWIEINDDKY